MVQVYSNNSSPRLKYVLDFCFKAKGQSYEIFNSVDKINSSQNLLNYSNEKLENGINLEPAGILSEVNTNANYSLSIDNGLIHINGVRDPLGIIFYLLSRYEEHSEYEKDEHDRYLSKQHSLVQLNLQTQPIVDLIVKKLWEDLSLDYSKVAAGYKFIPTFDIDVAWAYKNKSSVRQLGSAIKNRGNKERAAVLLGNKKDPYDTYDEIVKIGQRFDDLKVFMLLGDYGTFDKNIHPENKNLRELINRLAEHAEIGIHPSYASYLNPDKVEQEKNRLENITDTTVASSRQHFLKLKIPNSYQLLNEKDIQHDYSMGFSDNIGFRAGTSFPFNFFDLTNNASTELLVHPYAYMDGTFRQYLKKTPIESIEIINDLIANVKAVGGDFISIWHNSSINDYGEWAGWKRVFDFTIEKGAK